MQQTYAPADLYAGFWRRAAAIIIDALVVGIPLSIIGGIGNLNSSAGWNLVRLIVQWLYFAFLESSEYQATLGKMALGIKVTDLEGNRISFGRATGRYFAKFISAIILFIGFIMAAFTERKQALHDMIAGTLVVRKEAAFATSGAGAYGGAGSYGAPPPPPSSAPPPAPPPMAPSGGVAAAAPPAAPETAEPPAPADPEAATGEAPREARREEGETPPG